MGIHTDEYLDLLRRVLEVYAECRDRYGMESLSMAEAVVVASGRHLQRAA